MSFIRTVKSKDNPYVVMDKAGLQDCGLSRKAKGILAYLLSLPDNREIYLSDLSSRSIDGGHSVTQGVKELEESGYIKKGQRLRKENGGLGGYEYEVYETSMNGYLFMDQEGKRSTSIKTIKKSYPGKSQVGKSYIGKSPDNKETSEICNESNELPIDNYNISIPVKNFIKQQYETIPGIKYQADKDGMDLYLAKQAKEWLILVKEVAKMNVTEEMLALVLDRIVGSTFRSHNIGSITKLRKKNKEGVPYRVVMIGEIKKSKQSEKIFLDGSQYK